MQTYSSFITKRSYHNSLHAGGNVGVTFPFLSSMFNMWPLDPWRPGASAQWRKRVSELRQSPCSLAVPIEVLKSTHTLDGWDIAGCCCCCTVDSILIKLLLKAARGTVIASHAIIRLDQECRKCWILQEKEGRSGHTVYPSPSKVNYNATRIWYVKWPQQQTPQIHKEKL